MKEELEALRYMLKPEPGSATRFRSACGTVSACVLPSECHVHVPLLQIDARGPSLDVAGARAMSHVRKAAETCSGILKRAEGPPTEVQSTNTVECGQYIPGHHGGNCTLPQGHKGEHYE